VGRRGPWFTADRLTDEERAKLSDPTFLESLSRMSKRTEQEHSGPKGHYEFVTETPGIYAFEVQVRAESGKVLHTDHAIADLSK
jgi:hypothetical protein